MKKESSIVGIIGQGFVGSAIREGLKSHYEIKTYDLEEEKCNSTLEEVCQRAGIIFVCVPTPMRLNGSCDTRILVNAIKSIDDTCIKINRSRDEVTIVIKSTIPPGTTKRINEKFDNLTICFSPEFLTEANSFDDFKNQNRIIIGIPSPSVTSHGSKVSRMFKKVFTEADIRVVWAEEAEMCKYFINCFLATKVTFANQMFEICKSADIDYSNVISLATLDPRIGNSHLTVPGPDGDRGFGGHCFPKDLAAMIKFSEIHKVTHERSTFLPEVQRSNEVYRTNRDWEKMKGRAVSDD